AEPAYCGLGTLVNVLNALEVDPGIKSIGSWRWYSEEMLDCCVDLEEVSNWIIRTTSSRICGCWTRDGTQFYRSYEVAR
ncbi:MAG: hypothetical protein SGPRY_014882, partial [Prymnesium sp.]